MSTPLQPAPARLHDAGRTHLGRFDGPVSDVNLAAPGLARMRLKEWHYTSVTTERSFAAFAIVQLGYVANVFAYVVDRARPHRPHAMTHLAPLGHGVSFARSSVSGTTRFDGAGQHIAVHYDEGGFSVDLGLVLDGTDLRGRFECRGGQSGSIAHRLPHGGVAYTHKATLYDVTGDLRYGSRPLIEGEALGTLDWTRSQAARETVWKWASFAGRDTEGRKVGLNLSADVYDDAAGDSLENFFYTEEGTSALGGVRFEVPRAPRHMPWRIRSRSGDEVDLSFEPLGARSEDVRLAVLESRFVQPYGLYYGRIRDHRLDGVFGVVEDHRATW